MGGVVKLVGAVVLALALAASAAGQATERGVTPTEIVLGTSMPMTGPAAFWGTGVSGGIDAWLRHVNDQGGIHGRRFRFVVRDDAYLPPRAIANVRELVERVGVFAIVSQIGTANCFAVRDFMVETRTLWITPACGADIWAGMRERNRYLFVTYPSYTDEGIFLTRYAAQNLRARNVAVFYQNDLYGQQGLLGVRRGIAQVRGVRLVSHVSYEVTDAEVSAQALRLRDSGADTLFLYATPRHGALIVREIARIGYRPTLVSTFTLLDPIMFQLAGDAWNDVYLASYIPLPGTDPRVDAVLATITRINPELARNPFNAIAGVSFIEAFLEGIRRTGPNLTKDRLVASMETIRNWDGEVIRGVTFTPESRQGINRLFMAKAERGRYVRLSDWVSYQRKF
ncbi:MAG: ABC transporter substrate-binding protein [Armatimonadota bacterium]|nr:ABC transporter substrate-binding protein [Armatimonadota bacterium]